MADETLPNRVELPRLSKDEQTSDKMLEVADRRLLLKHYRASRRDYGTVQHAILELMWHVGGRISCFRALDLDDELSRRRPDTEDLDVMSEENDDE